MPSPEMVLLFMAAWLASRATGWLRANARRAATLQRATGVLFIGLGARLAWR